VERYLQKVISETNGKLTMTKPKEEKMKNKTQKEREEFTKLAESVKLRIEQQRTPNEEGANSALKKLVDYHMEALSQKEDAVRREVLEEVWLEVRHSKPKFYGKDIDDETEQLIQDISYETKCQILDDIHELFPVKSKYSQEAPSPKYDKTK